MISFNSYFSMNDNPSSNEYCGSLFSLDYEKDSISNSPIIEEFNFPEHHPNLTRSGGELCELFEKENELEYQPASDKMSINIFEDKNETIIEKKGSNDISSDTLDNNNINNTLCTKTKNNKQIFRGRKRKEDTRERVHSKYTKDNQMRRIKTYFIRFIYKRVNSSLSHGHKKFRKISPKVNENLKADYNIELMKKRLKTIFEENPINGRYSKSEIGKDYNAKLIKEIYKKNEEIETIKILNASYIEYLNFMKTHHLQEFKDEIFEKEVKCGESKESSKKYVDKLVKLLFNYEGWFSGKTPRSPKKIST